MLYADKKALETNLKVDLLSIRERELNFYTANCQAIGTQAAMFAGFAFAGLMQPLPPEPESLRVLFLVSTVFALGLQLVTVVTTTLLSMLAPGLALRGSDGAMHTAVDGMVEEYRQAFYTFILGVLAIHFAAVFFVWLAFPEILKAGVLTVCLFVSLVLLYRYMRKLMVHFAIPKEEVEVGTFEGAEASAAGSLAGVSDSDEINTLSALIANSQQLELARQNELAAAQEGPGGIALQGGVALPAGVALKGGVALGKRPMREMEMTAVSAGGGLGVGMGPSGAAERVGEPPPNAESLGFFGLMGTAMSHVHRMGSSFTRL